MHSDDSRRTAGGAVALLILFVALAAATVWFVALPVIDQKPRAERTCEVFVLKTGSIRCVPEKTRASGAAPHAKGRATR